MIKYLFSLCFLYSIPLFSQDLKQNISQEQSITKALIFGYDDAGNQIFRNQNLFTGPPIIIDLPPNMEVISEPESFWLNIQIYPVPVKSILTLTWNIEYDDLIESVSLYQHSTLAHLFQKKNIPALNRNLPIEMSSLSMGVYILTFRLKDGRTFSKNITKL